VYKNIIRINIKISSLFVVHTV